MIQARRGGPSGPPPAATPFPKTPSPMSEQIKRVVRTPVRIGGRWFKIGETATLSRLDAETYDHAFEPTGDKASETVEPGAAYLPGQEPQAPLALDPLTLAQAEAGDISAEKQVERQGKRVDAEGRGDRASEAAIQSGKESDDSPEPSQTYQTRVSKAAAPAAPKAATPSKPKAAK